jgi:hypothetical protein
MCARRMGKDAETSADLIDAAWADSNIYNPFLFFVSVYRQRLLLSIAYEHSRPP